MNVLDDLSAAIAATESNDCAVRAVAAVTRIPYAVVHGAYHKAGRKRGEGSGLLINHRAFKHLGLMSVLVPNGHGLTQKQITKQLAGQRVDLLVEFNNHLSAVVAGEWIDHFPKRKSLVAYQLVPNETIAAAKR